MSIATADQSDRSISLVLMASSDYRLSILIIWVKHNDSSLSNFVCKIHGVIICNEGCSHEFVITKLSQLKFKSSQLKFISVNFVDYACINKTQISNCNYESLSRRYLSNQVDLSSALSIPKLACLQS